MVTYGCGTNLGGCYSVVYGESYDEVMSDIFSVTNGEFAFTYIDEDDIDRQIKEYGLKEVKLQSQVVL